MPASSPKPVGEASNPALPDPPELLVKHAAGSDPQSAATTRVVIDAGRVHMEWAFGGRMTRKRLPAV
jgi:hypothetical protein